MYYFWSGLLGAIALLWSVLGLRMLRGMAGVPRQETGGYHRGERSAGRPVVPLLAAALRTTQSERIIVFPMAVVPNLWGLWNMLFIALHSRRRLPIGLHGAILPFVLAPIAFIVTRLVGFGFPAFFICVIPIAFPVALVLYYLAWKYLVGFLNRVQDLA